MMKKKSCKCLRCGKKVNYFTVEYWDDGNCYELRYICPLCGKKQKWEEGFGNEELIVQLFAGEFNT